MKKIIYSLQFVVAVWTLFVAVDAFCHWHFDVINPVELYQIDKDRYESENGCEISFMNYEQWKEEQQLRTESLYDEIGYQIAESFDPWFERPNVTEKGRD